MAINPDLIEIKKVTELDDLALALENYFAHCGADGVLGKANMQDVATFIAPYIAAIGASSYIATTGTVLSNPTDKDAAFTFVGAGTFTQTTGGDVVTTEPLNVLSWNGTTWSLSRSIPIPGILDVWVSKQYSVGQFVSHSGAIWRANQSVPTGNEPGKTVHWDSAAASLYTTYPFERGRKSPFLSGILNVEIMSSVDSDEYVLRTFMRNIGNTTEISINKVNYAGVESAFAAWRVFNAYPEGVGVERLPLTLGGVVGGIPLAYVTVDWAKTAPAFYFGSANTFDTRILRVCRSVELRQINVYPFTKQTGVPYLDAIKDLRILGDVRNDYYVERFFREPEFNRTTLYIYERKQDGTSSLYAQWALDTGYMPPLGQNVVRFNLGSLTGSKGYIVIDWTNILVSFAYTNPVWTDSVFSKEVITTPDREGLSSSAYEVRDDIKQTVIVDINGAGNYTTLAAAYAAITDSRFDNQYKILVYPGEHSGSGLIPPAFTHTIGVGNAVIRDKDTATPTFDQQDWSSKLSNLTIHKTGVGSYCIHFDRRNSYTTIVNTNLTLIRTGDPTAPPIGGGSWNEYKPIWRGCRFIGTVPPTCHTNGNENNASMNLVLDGCSLSIFRLGQVGAFGQHNARFDNCSGVIGIPTVQFFFSKLRNVDQPSTYLANHMAYDVIGGGNSNFSIKPLEDSQQGQALMFEALNNTDQILISGSAVPALFGAYRTIKGGVRLKCRVIGSVDVRDVTSGLPPYSPEQDVIQMWKRLGDCSVNNKTLTVTIGGTPITYTFSENYLLSKKVEGSIISEINAVITSATLQKYTPSDDYDNIKTNEKISALVGSGSILKWEFVRLQASGYAFLAPENSVRSSVTGIAVTSATISENIDIYMGNLWVGLGYIDGQYGVGSDNKLSNTVTNKIGFVSGGIFYFN